MPQYRMIAIDLDGTLLSPTGEVTPRVKLAVQNCLTAGLLVCFATGRNWTESRAVLDTVEHWPTAVFVGGAMVVDTDKELTLHRTMMDPALAREVCQCLEGHGHAVLVLQETGSAGVNYLMSGDLPLNDATRMWMKATAAKITRVDRLASHPHDHTIRVGICAGADEVATVKDELTARFGSRIVAHNLMVPSYGVEVLEVFDPAVNKWEGIMFVARRHGVLAEQIVAIGDDVNDIPMIKNAGLGVAMGNARPAVQAVAKRVIGANADEGLAIFLDELVANHVVEPLEKNFERPSS
ncbi:MAG TPA: HAD family hydrolase [Tepidisphaeraceae bacterium]|nr:HAD family hydrolase [Tepidisphaeraceae bacterium]